MNLKALVLAASSALLITAPSGSEAKMEAPPLLPQPQTISGFKTGSDWTRFNLTTLSQQFGPEAKAFAEDWPKLVSEKGLRVVCQLDPKLQPEEHHLSLGKGVSIRAGSRVGVAWALSTLAQLGFSATSQATIHDKPETEFRCLTLDVARRYHSVSALRQLVAWCQAAKVRLIQLHLTDDQNWMLPTKVLAGIDKLNSHGRAAYTFDEVRSLVKFASARGIAFVPEIDVPGHSSLLIRHDPDLFKITGSPSSNCINFGSPSVRKTLKDLFREAAGLFSTAPYIHIGGDEAWHPEAEKDPLMAESMARLGKSAGVSEVFVDFVADLAETVISTGKKPLIWEGFGPSDYAKKRIPKQAVIIAWEGPYYPAKQLLADGFTIVNAGWDPCYVVNHYPYDSYTLAPLPTLYQINPFRFGTVNWSDPAKSGDDLPASSQVKGSMLSWWEGHEWNALSTLPLRILAFGAHLWNPKEEADYEAFRTRCQAVQRVNSSRLHPFSLQVQGGPVTSSGAFSGTLKVTSLDPTFGLKLACRKDGRTPLPGDSSLPAEITETGVLTVQAYKGSKPVGETAYLSLHKSEFISNLALGAKVTCSSPEDPQFPASSVTDGVSDQVGSFWLGYPAPCSLNLDLGLSKLASRVDVVPFWAAGATARYRVDISLDGDTWKDVTDQAELIKPITKSGAVHRFATQMVRYVRVTFASSTQYPASMARIHEVRVFKE